MNKATLFDLVHASFVDGPGIRTTVFFKGCNLHCPWCHNPEGISPHPQLMFYQERCTKCGKCKEKCPSPNSCLLCGACAFYCPAEARKLCGEEKTVEEILEEISADKTFYDHSGGGVTFSGGECMLQPEALFSLLKGCKERGVHTAVDTAGHVPFSSFEKILPYTDLFLYDIKLLDSKMHKRLVGVDNDLILENLQRLLQKGARVWIRVPIIPEINDSPEEMKRLRAFLAPLPPPEKIELLPYHPMGSAKAKALGLLQKEFDTPEKERMELLSRIFS